MPPPSMRNAWKVIAILWLVTLFSQLDRQLPALLVAPIKTEFQIGDTQFSLLQGYAFALAYTLMGLPFGRLVDRVNRRNLIMGGILLWSTMTILAGFATSYNELVITRIGVGVGEAVLAPAAYSIIADCVAPSNRGRALAVYYVSLGVGSGASLLFGGLILGYLPPEGMEVAGLGLLEPWQLVFIIAGLPGPLLALLMMRIQEPLRREIGRIAYATVRDFIAHLRRHRVTFICLMSYPALLAMIGYGVLAWATALFGRRFGIPAPEAGVTLGLIMAGCGLTGTLIGGTLSDYWHRQGRLNARFRVALVAWVIILPAATLWPVLPIAVASYVAIGIVFVGFGMGQSAAPVSIQEIVPNSMRGQAIALYLMIAGLLGIGLGPTSIALVTEHVLRDESQIGYALVLVSVPAALLAIAACLIGQKPYARSVEEMRRSNDAGFPA